MAQAGSGEKLKVFISYSRRDSSDFAEELVTGLQLAGFAPFLDRHDIAPGEPWEERLAGLIQQADTVVYVISPAAAKSERCGWEVDKALALSKRLLPVVFKPVGDADIPEQLRRRQYVRFDTGLGITRPLAQLADALRQDIDWIREHTRLSDLAARWEARGRPGSLLLRADEVSAAQAWAEKRRPDAPGISDLLWAYIAASKEAEAVQVAKSKLAQRRARWSQALASASIVIVVAGIAAWWRQDWLGEQIYRLVYVRTLTAAQERALKPRDSFKECSDCPEVVVVPSGSFLMGSPPGQGDESEHPQHKVMFAKPFAVSKHELTFADWDACVIQRGCREGVNDRGWGRGTRPVIEVNWKDAIQYVRWLSKITGKTYRLLSEAEYEYAARGGTTTRFPWGDDVGAHNANCHDCGSEWDHKQTAPVGSFPSNNFGLYDMVGNVDEWVEDCQYFNYKDAPTDGSAWGPNLRNCTVRIVRSCSFICAAYALRPALRGSQDWEYRASDLSFRVARTLGP